MNHIVVLRLKVISLLDKAPENAIFLCLTGLLVEFSQLALVLLFSLLDLESVKLVQAFVCRGRRFGCLPSFDLSLFLRRRESIELLLNPIAFNNDLLIGLESWRRLQSVIVRVNDTSFNGEFLLGCARWITLCDQMRIPLDSSHSFFISRCWYRPSMRR